MARKDDALLTCLSRVTEPADQQLLLKLAQALVERERTGETAAFDAALMAIEARLAEKARIARG